MFGAFLGGWEIVLILAVVLILFGAKKLPELAKGLGQGIKEFKKASREVTEEIQGAMEDDNYSAPPPKKIEPAQKTLPESSESPVPHSTEHKP
jgi:sec-independent protein translocase protein TatA